jgi:Zn-dependent protease
MITPVKQVLSILFTLIVYALVLHSWLGAAVIVVTICWHEQCHLWEAQSLGYQTGKFFLTPFLGGISFVNSKYQSYVDQALVAMAGPNGGAFGAGATLILYFITGAPWLISASYCMCFLNIFNLLPLSFLDGGQVLGTITYSINKTLGVWVNVISTVLAVIILIKINWIIAVFLAFFGGKQVMGQLNNWFDYRAGHEHLCSDSYLNPPQKMSILQGILTGCYWLLTVVLLIGMMIWMEQIAPQQATITYLFNH